jgi:hypothetical protein
MAVLTSHEPMRHRVEFVAGGIDYPESMVESIQNRWRHVE